MNNVQTEHDPRDLSAGWIRCFVLPNLVVGLTADPQHLFALQLQLSGQGVDGLVQRVDLMIQIRDAVATGIHL